MNRIGDHQVLRTDPDFREFLELETDLPKATGTSALSSAGVKRLFSRVGETVNKMTYKMDETDPVEYWIVLFFVMTNATLQPSLLCAQFSFN